MTNTIPTLTARTNVALETMAMEAEWDAITAEHDAMELDGYECELLGMNDTEVSKLAMAIAANGAFALLACLITIL